MRLKRVEYADLPPAHYANLRRLRDLLAACILLEPRLALLPRASKLSVIECADHALGDLLGYARTSPHPNYRELLAMRLVEKNEVLRLVAVAESGECWAWLSEWYAYKLQQLLELECTYVRLVVSYDEDPVGTGKL